MREKISSILLPLPTKINTMRGKILAGETETNTYTSKVVIASLQE
jgi:hypothetical protein